MAFPRIIIVVAREPLPVSAHHALLPQQPLEQGRADTAALRARVHMEFGEFEIVAEQLRGGRLRPPGSAHPRVHLHFTPTYSSWLNQVELWFSVLQRRVIRNGSFDHRGRIRSEVEAFVRYWNLYEKKPFRWTFDGRFEQPQRSAA